jgi:hypothetical protein
MSLENKLKHGQYEIDTDANRITFLDQRVYKSGGECFPSVTTILSNAYPTSPEFLEWLKKNGENADSIRDEAGSFGSTVHNLIDRYNKGEMVSVFDSDGAIRIKMSEWACLTRYIEFYERFQPEILYSELNLISPYYKIGGTVDIRANLPLKKGTKKLMIDIKTSKNLHNQYFLQGAAYIKLHNEAFPEDQIDEFAILWLNAKTRGEGKGDAIQGLNWQLVFPDKPMEHYWNMFQHTYALWEEEYGEIKPKELSYQLSYKK